jgi:hypothetical protein
MPKLLEEGLVTRDGLGYHPVDAPAEVSESAFAEVIES